jgi:hypothetical protein
MRSFVEHARLLPGALSEGGVYRGGSAQVIASAVRDAGSKVPLHLFDTFSATLRWSR